MSFLDYVQGVLDNLGAQDTGAGGFASPLVQRLAQAGDALWRGRATVVPGLPPLAYGDTPLAGLPLRAAFAPTEAFGLGSDALMNVQHALEGALFAGLGGPFGAGGDPAAIPPDQRDFAERAAAAFEAQPGSWTHPGDVYAGLQAAHDAAVQGHPVQSLGLDLLTNPLTYTGAGTAAELGENPTLTARAVQGLGRFTQAAMKPLEISPVLHPIQAIGAAKGGLGLLSELVSRLAPEAAPEAEAALGEVPRPPATLPALPAGPEMGWPDLPTAPTPAQWRGYLGRLNLPAPAPGELPPPAPPPATLPGLPLTDAESAAARAAFLQRAGLAPDQARALSAPRLSPLSVAQQLPPGAPTLEEAAADLLNRPPSAPPAGTLAHRQALVDALTAPSAAEVAPAARAAEEAAPAGLPIKTPLDAGAPPAAAAPPSRAQFIAGLLGGTGPFTLRQFLPAALTANYGGPAGASGALRAIFGRAEIPGDEAIASPFLDYQLARLAEQPAALARLEQAAPDLAAAVKALPPASASADEIQNIVRGLVGTPAKGAPQAAQAAQEALQATGAPALASAVTPDLYRQATDLVASRDNGNPGFGGPYLPGPSFFAKRLGLTDAAATDLWRRLAADPAVSPAVDTSGTPLLPPHPQAGTRPPKPGTPGGLPGQLPADLALRLGGAAAGGLAGATQGPGASPRDRARDAAVGALLGYGATGPVTRTLLARGGRQELEAFGNKPNLNPLNVGFYRALRRTGPYTIPRNIGSDTLNTLIAGASPAEFLGNLGQRLGALPAYDAAMQSAATPADRAAAELARAPARVRALETAIGDTPALPDLGETFVRQDLGAAGRENPLTSAAKGAMLAAPFAAFTGPAALGVGALTGLALPFAARVQSDVLGQVSQAARESVYTKELAPLLEQAAGPFLAKARAAGVDVAGLSDEGLFKPAQVPDPALASEWGATVARARDEAALAARTAFGDFNRPAFGPLLTPLLGAKHGTRVAQALENTLEVAAPGGGWALRQGPIVARALADRPQLAIPLAAALAYNAQQHQADPEHTGEIQLRDRTPLVGPAVRALNGGAPGSFWVDPSYPFSPAGGGLFGLPYELNAARRVISPYEAAIRGAQAVGLSPSPALELPLYLSGVTSSPPASPIRLVDVGEGQDLLRGQYLPNPTGLLLDALRSIKGGASASDVLNQIRFEFLTDPNVERRVSELAIERTGKPLDDPSNAALRLQAVDPNSPLYREAATQVAHGKINQSLANFFLPAQGRGQTATAAAAERAAYALPTPDMLRMLSAGLPLSPAARATLAPALALAARGQAGPQGAANVQAAIDALKAQNPVAATYDLTDPTALRQQVLRDFRAAHPSLWTAPTYAQALLGQLAERIGLAPLGGYAQQQEQLDLARRGIGGGDPFQLVPGVPLPAPAGRTIPFQPAPYFGRGGAGGAAPTPSIGINQALRALR